jgi:hypothetical protein
MNRRDGAATPIWCRTIPPEGMPVGVGLIKRSASAMSAEVARLRGVVVCAWRKGGFRSYLVTCVFAGAILLLWLLDHSAARQVVATCCGERVGEPVRSGLLRLPGSIVAPAPMLPVWGSIVQVVLAFGLSEAAVGRLRTLVVAGVAHVVATLAGRYFVWYAPPHLGGLSASWLNAIDTGPSAATVALAVYLAIVLRCPRLGSVVIVVIAADFAARTDLAGREHLVALLVGAICGVVQLLILRRSTRFADRDSSELELAEGNAGELELAEGAPALGDLRPR